MCFSEWEAMLLRRLGPIWRVCKHLVQHEIRLTIFIRAGADHGMIRPSVRSARAGSAGGSKRGLLVRFASEAMSLTFISCHLTAHAQQLSERNADCIELLRETRSIGASLMLLHVGGRQRGVQVGVCGHC